MYKAVQHKKKKSTCISGPALVCTARCHQNIWLLLHSTSTIFFVLCYKSSGYCAGRVLSPITLVGCSTVFYTLHVSSLTCTRHGKSVQLGREEAAGREGSQVIVSTSPSPVKVCTICMFHDPCFHLSLMECVAFPFTSRSKLGDARWLALDLECRSILENRKIELS